MAKTVQNTGVCLDVGCAILHKAAVFRWDDRLPVHAVYSTIIHRVIAAPWMVRWMYKVSRSQKSLSGRVGRADGPELRAV